MTDRTIKQRRKRILPVLMLLLFVLPMLLTAAIPLFGQSDFSVGENRAKTLFPRLSWKSFLSGTFQDQLEEALTDQWPASESVKAWDLDQQNRILAMQQELLYAAAPELRSSYRPIAAGYYHYADDEHTIVEKPKEYDTEGLRKLAENVRGSENVRLLLYFIENSRSVNFDLPDPEHGLYHTILDTIMPDDAELFAVPDYETYRELFYETDHHWNYKGSDLGYRAIYRLLHGTEDGMIPPGEVITTDAVFQGSYARQTHDLCSDEVFVFQTYDLPAYTTLINGKRKQYGNQKIYEKGKYPSEPLSNHYANCYGGDYGQIEYDFGTEGKGRLLLIASSYSNPINALIAAGYDHTFVIDLRYYADFAGKAFDTASFCRENDIDTVLLLGDVNLFFDEEAKEGGE